MADTQYHRVQTSVWNIFFSLKGTLPRNQWRLAMIIAVAIFTLGLKLPYEDVETDDTIGTGTRPSWLFILWCLSFLWIVSLLSAKRLLDCRRPVGLALAVVIPGLLIILALAAGVSPTEPITIIVFSYIALFMLPALVACARLDADD